MASLKRQREEAEQREVDVAALEKASRKARGKRRRGNAKAPTTLNEADFARLLAAMKEENTTPQQQAAHAPPAQSKRLFQIPQPQFGTQEQLKETPALQSQLASPSQQQPPQLLLQLPQCLLTPRRDSANFFCATAATRRDSFATGARACDPSRPGRDPAATRRIFSRLAANPRETRTFHAASEIPQVKL